MILHGMALRCEREATPALPDGTKVTLAHLADIQFQVDMSWVRATDKSTSGPGLWEPKDNPKVEYTALGFWLDSQAVPDGTLKRTDFWRSEVRVHRVCGNEWKLLAKLNAAHLLRVHLDHETEILAAIAEFRRTTEAIRDLHNYLVQTGATQKSLRVGNTNVAISLDGILNAELHKISAAISPPASRALPRGDMRIMGNESLAFTWVSWTDNKHEEQRSSLDELAKMSQEAGEY